MGYIPATVECDICYTVKSVDAKDWKIGRVLPVTKTINISHLDMEYAGTDPYSKILCGDNCVTKFVQNSLPLIADRS